MPGRATQKLLDYLEFRIVHEVHDLVLQSRPIFRGLFRRRLLREIGSCAGLCMQPSYVWYFLPLTMERSINTRALTPAGFET